VADFIRGVAVPSRSFSDTLLARSDACFGATSGGPVAPVMTDPRRRDRVVLIALVGYVALWTTYAVLAKGSQDLHFDMGELIAWSREPAFGYAKHPPFAAWLVGAPGRNRAAVHRGPSAVKLFRRRLVASAARTRAWIDHAG